MDFLVLWKASSIVLTGSFGILGLVKDFKDKNTGHITKWGRLSLAGILLSTTLGVIAQLKESSNQQRASAATAKETLALAQKTDQTVRDVQRMLSPMEDPEIEIDFDVACEEPLYKAICMDMGKWPGGPEVKIGLLLNFFRDKHDAKSFIAGDDVNPDLSLYFSATNVSPTNYQGADYIRLERGDGNRLFLFASDNAPEFRNSNGKIRSTLDFAGTVVLITAAGLGEEPLTGLKPNRLEIRNKDGQTITANPERFEKVNFSGEVAYRGFFP